MKDHEREKPLAADSLGEAETSADSNYIPADAWGHEHSSSVSSLRDLLRCDREAGIHDPQGSPPEDVIEALNQDVPPPQLLSFASSFASNDHEGQLEAFEGRKQKMKLGFAPAWRGMLLLANTLLGGSGMLGVPHAFSVAGYVLGTILLLLFCAASMFGSHLLACTAKKVARAPSSFNSVSKKVVPKWAWVVDAVVMIKCAGVATSYLIIAGDLLPEALSSMGAPVARWLCVLLGWFIGATLACFEHLTALRYSASLVVVIVFWTAIMILVFFFAPGDQFQPCPGYDRSPCNSAKIEAFGTNAIALLKGLPVFIFSFTCQQNVFTVANEVKNATNLRMTGGIIIPAYVISAAFFLATALLGYFTYGDKVESDVLKNYPTTTIVAITKLAYALVAIFSFPLQIHPSRFSSLVLWRLVRPSRIASDPSRYDAEQARCEKIRYWIVTSVIVLGTLAVAISVKDLGVILGIVGATGSTTVSYILPGLVYFSCFKERTLKRYMAIVLFAMGMVIMPTCLVVLFIKA
mmetsp:Transcript_5221/g.8426  ORF Transcript_5221/g.8426 Transcript_5221/m.8426 type:complete len:521 (+) Transcript_5221:34-1596(+)